MPAPTPVAFRKHREARYRYRGSFSRYLAEGESISDPALRVERWVNYDWTDVSDEILVADSALIHSETSSVEFLLRGAATADEQAPGVYRVVALVDSSSGERPVGVAEFEVDP